MFGITLQEFEESLKLKISLIGDGILDSTYSDIIDGVNKLHESIINFSGTDSNMFYVGGVNGPKFKNNSGVMEVRNSADSDYANLVVNNIIIKGTPTEIQSEIVLIQDNILTLNSNFEGDNPIENGGLEIKRGVLTNASLIWDESNDKWKCGLMGEEIGISLEGHIHTINELTTWFNFTPVNKLQDTIENYLQVLNGKIKIGTDSVNPNLTLGLSSDLGTMPYIDFTYGTGGSQEYSVRLQNTEDGILTVFGNLKMDKSLCIDAVNARNYLKFDLGEDHGIKAFFADPNGDFGLRDEDRGFNMFIYQSTTGIFNLIARTRIRNDIGIDAGKTIYFGREELFGDVNYGGNDHGYITWYNNLNDYKPITGGSAIDNGCLVIGTADDPIGPNADFLVLKGYAANIFDPVCGINYVKGKMLGVDPVALNDWCYRNIYIGTTIPSASQGKVGDVVILYKPIAT